MRQNSDGSGQALTFVGISYLDLGLRFSAVPGICIIVQYTC